MIQIDTEFKFGGNPSLQKYITQLFSAHGRLQTLLRYFFAEEIKETNEQCTLFRGISLATSIFAGQFYINGKRYVRRLTLPLVSAICSSERSWDVSFQFNLKNNSNLIH